MWLGESGSIQAVNKKCYGKIAIQVPINCIFQDLMTESFMCVCVSFFVCEGVEDIC